MSRIRPYQLVVRCVVPGLMLWALHASAALPVSSPAAYADMTLEQLSNIQVTAVSRRAEPLANAAGSLFVITADDIRRSGATSLPEALRLAVNLQVARADANQYPISARGFNSTTANKMLTLIDGRTVYSPLFSGVFWEAQAVGLEDVERIEVMSGGGGAAWGSNAVNGFINIITRPARETQGALVAIGSGTRDRVTLARYGAQAGGGHYRIYGRLSRREHSVSAAGNNIRDGSTMAQAGFRGDWVQGGDTITLQGDVYTSDIDQDMAPAYRRIGGVNLLGRLTRQLKPGSTLHLQTYVDRTERDQPGVVRDALNTVDVEFHHDVELGARQGLLWGGGYRQQRDRLTNLGPNLAFMPEDRNLSLLHVFAQHRMAITPALDWTTALKFERNSYTGWEYMPSTSLAWQMAPGSVLWGSIGRTVRIPSRLDRELFLPATPPFTTLAGGPDFESEISTVYELGYRGQFATAGSYSVTLYRHEFDRLRSIEPTAAGPVLRNGIAGHAQGLEAWGSYQVHKNWRLRAGLTLRDANLHVKPGRVAIGGVSNLGNDPKFSWTLGTSIDLAPALELDMTLRRVGALPNPALDAYTVADARLGWAIRRDLELSLTASNLFNARHAEWGAAPGHAVFGRALFMNLVWRP